MATKCNNKSGKAYAVCKLEELRTAYPGDFVVVANRWSSDFKISPPFTHRKEAKEYYSKSVKHLDTNWKTQILQLTDSNIQSFQRWS